MWDSGADHERCSPKVSWTSRFFGRHRSGVVSLLFAECSARLCKEVAKG